MKKIALIAAVLVFATTVFAQGACNGANFAEHGTMQMGVEANCWVFTTDAGVTYQPVGGPNLMYREGLSGVLTGTLNPDVMTTCMQGPVVTACSFDADNTVTVVGTLTYSGLENGCWILKAGNRTYQPLCEDPAFFVDGAKVKVAAIQRFDIRTMCMVGGVIEVLAYDVVGGGQNGSTTTQYSAQTTSCQAQYAKCVKICRENYCFISCETLLNICLGR